MASSSAVRGVSAREALPVFILRLAPNPLHHGAVAIARSLGELGAEVWGAVGLDGTPLAHSRHLAGTLRLELPTRDEVSIVEQLLEWAAERNDRPLLISIDDAAAVFVADNAERLAGGFRFPRLPDGLARRLSSKLELGRICTAAGVPTPRTRVPADEDELAQAAAELSFPVMVKRISEWDPATQSGPRMARAESSAELHRRFEEMRGPETPNLLLQEYVGDGVDWMFNGYFDEHSRCLFGATGIKVRQYPVGTGPTSLGECRRNDEVRGTAVDLLRSVGYRGIVDAGMRLDPRSGEYKVLDVNPRIGSTFRLFTGQRGMDVARALYLDVIGRPVEEDAPRDGRRWLVENYDLAAAIHEVRAGDLSPAEWVRSLRGVREVAWASLGDPAPAAAALTASVRALVNRREGTGRTAPRMSTQDAVDAHFDAHAAYWRAVYDPADRDGLVYRQRLSRVLAIVTALALPPGSRVLEIGSGAGVAAVALARLGLVVDAVDSAPEMVAQTQTRARDSGFGERVAVHHAGVSALPFAGASHDLVVALGVFPWLSNPGAAAAEIARVLRPGGRAVVTADNRTRLSELVDPLTGSAFHPLRAGVKALLTHAGRRPPAAEQLAHRTSPAEFRAVFTAAGLAVAEVRTSGFRRPTVLGKPLLPFRLATSWQNTLQRAADGGVPFVRWGGEHLVLLARKAEEDGTECAS